MKKLRLLPLACVGFAGLTTTIPFATVQAADVTWDNGAANGFWTNGTNWNPSDTLPGVNDIAIIGGSGNVDATNAATVDALRITRAVTITNGTITMDATANPSGGSGIFQINTGSYAATIGADLNFSGSTTSGSVSVFRMHDSYTGTLTLNGSVSVANNLGAAGSKFIDVSGAGPATGTIIFNGAITNTRTTGFTELDIRAATVELNASNTWNLGGGGLRLANGGGNGTTGTLKLGNANALGASANPFAIGSSDGTIGANTYVSQVLQTGANTISNNTTIRNSAGTNVLGADIASGTATYSGSLTLNNVTTGGTAGAIQLKSVQSGGTVVFSGNIVDGNTGQAVLRDLTITGLGTVRLSGSANTYSGNTIINSGTLQLGANNVLPDGSGKGNVTFNPSSGTATIDINGRTETINGLSSSGAGTSVVDNSTGAGSLSVGNNNASSTFAGSIRSTAGTLALTKLGTGTLTLSGSNSYTGTTTISNGTLAVTGSGTLGSSNNRLAIGTAGGTLDLGATTQLVDNVLINGASTITNGTLSIGANTNQSGGTGIFQIMTGSYANTIGANLTFTGTTNAGTVNVFRINDGYNGTTTINGAVTVSNNLGSGAGNSKFIDVSGGGTPTGTIIFNGAINSTRSSGTTKLDIRNTTMELNASNTWNLGGSALELYGTPSSGTGTLKLGNGGAFGASTNVFTMGRQDSTVSGTYVSQVLQTAANTVSNAIVIRNDAATNVLGADIASGTATYSGNLGLTDHSKTA